MIGETGASVNKVITIGDKYFNASIEDELFCKADIKVTKIDKDVIPNTHMALRFVLRAEIIIVSLEQFTPVAISIISMGKALGKLIIGVGTEEYFEDPAANKDDLLLLELCDFTCMHEDIVYEVTKYL